MAVTLMNVFIVPADREEEFLTHWQRTTEVFRQRAGFLETHLHRNTGVGNASFTFINVARWTSAEAWRDNHNAYQPTEYGVPGVTGHPAIFEAIVDVYADTMPADQRGGHWIAASER